MPNIENQSKLSMSFIIYFFLIFFFVQCLGLLVAIHYSAENVQMTIVNDDPDSIWNALAIIGYILFFTTLVLVLRKLFKKSNYLYLVEFLALFSGCAIVLGLFLPEVFAYLIALVLLVIKHQLLDRFSKTFFLKKLSLWYNNLLLSFAIAGAGAILGLSLGVIPVIVFIVLLSLYDVIAVFYTKHMVTLAKMFAKKRLAFCFSIPSSGQKKIYQLGGGDIAVPVAVSSSLFAVFSRSLLPISQSLLIIIAIWFVSCAGILWAFYIIRRTKVKIMPALPMQTILMLAVIAITFAVF